MLSEEEKIKRRKKRQAEYYQEHRDEILEKYANRTEEEREKYNARRRAWYWANHASARAYQEKYIKENREHLKECRNKHMAKYLKTRADTRELNRFLILDLLGLECKWCGYDWWPGLEIDHIYNDGAADKKQHYSSTEMLSYYLKNPQIAKQRLQTLCGGCNRAKGKYLTRHKDKKGKIITKKMVAKEFGRPRLARKTKKNR